MGSMIGLNRIFLAQHQFQQAQALAATYANQPTYGDPPPNTQHGGYEQGQYGQGQGQGQGGQGGQGQGQYGRGRYGQG
jgi:hypothetical protein